MNKENNKLVFFDNHEKKFNLEVLEKELKTFLRDCEKFNKGVKVAGRRFRLNSVKFAKEFKLIRPLTVKNNMSQ